MIHIFGDIHFRSNSGKDGPDWEYNNRAIVEYFKTLPIKIGDTVIFTGDVFDKTKHKGHVNHHALELMNHVAHRTEVAFYIITGNHETSKASGNNLDIMKGITYCNVIDSPQVVTDVNGHDILMLPHIDGKSYSSYLKDIEDLLKGMKPDIVLGHHFFPENAIMNTPSLDLDNVYTDYKYWIMGHDHKYKEISEKKICIGSMWPCNKGEAKYEFSYLTLDGDSLRCHRIPPLTFKKFVFIDWKSSASYVDTNDFVVVNVSCKKEEKNSLEAEIRQAVGEGLYEIVWEFEEETKESTIEVKSDSDLEQKFFAEEQVSDSVKEKCMGYLAAGEDE